MKTQFYRIKCLTNLHVGSGDVNYNIVDNEVERDFDGTPIIHASGIKGALRDMAEADVANRVFGESGSGDTCKSGTHKFLDAHLLARPMRISGSSSRASILVTTVAALNEFLSTLTAFGCNGFGVDSIAPVNFGDNEFLTGISENISVEDEKTGKLDDGIYKKIKGIIGDDFALVKEFDGYALPVVARNRLENGISRNLWYEEVVPHGSIFYFGVMCPEDAAEYSVPEKVQFGGHSSIGCGFTEIKAY